ncbi:uncharacterized protein LOC106475108, partial [Limulus polyphemus]|uniref:Uncharacterized protein LOC106475108 n=1 Tax=Limulus polyphemus TaxID=6850 RepID=A0ABM1RUG9_LIMPO
TLDPASTERFYSRWDVLNRAIQLKNWKPLSFEQITDSSEITVGEILGDLAAVATLRIRLSSRPKMNVTHDVKEKLLQVLLVQSQNLLTTSGCPIDQSILVALSKGRLECDISEETRKKFDHWYLQQVFQHCRQVALLHKQNIHHQQQTRINHLDQSPMDGAIVISNKHHHVPGHGAVFTSPPQGRTRIRTSFDPELELPKLQRWFAENQHPSRHQIQQYVKELNALESRRGRKPLDINNVVYWFKNARAAYKRAEQRYFIDPNGSRSPSGDYCEDSSPHEADNNTSDEFYKNNNVDSSKQRKIDFCSPKNGFKVDLQGSDKENPDNTNHTLDLSVRRETTDTNLTSGQSVQRDLVDMNNSSGQSVRQEITDTNNNSGDHNSNVSPSRHKRMEQAEVKEELPEDITDNSIDSCVSGDEDQDIDVTMITSESWEKSERSKTPRESLSHQDFENRDTSSSGPSHQVTPSASVSPYNMEERRKRNRTFIDPVTEVPRLEQWFAINTHPSHSMIVRFTHELNVMPYRQKFPKLEPKNIQFWFKNRRAKCKRLSLAAVKDSGPTMDRLAFQPLR